MTDEQDEIEIDEDDDQHDRERERGDDDGVEYADPRDEQEERRRALDARFDELTGFLLGPRPE